MYLTRRYQSQISIIELSWLSVNSILLFWMHSMVPVISFRCTSRIHQISGFCQWLWKKYVFVKTTRGTLIKIFQISITISKSLFCSSVKIKITYRILLQDGFSLEITWRLVESWCRLAPPCIVVDPRRGLWVVGNSISKIQEWTLR